MALMTESETRRARAAARARAASPSARAPEPSQDPSRGPAVRPAEPVRWDKVFKARQQIADGVYEDPTVLDFAVDKLLKALETKRA